MSFWTPDNLRAAAGGSWLKRPAGARPQPDIEGLSIDTRTIRQGEAFLALRGERFDGHDFLADAASAGSPLLIVDDPERVPADLPPGVAVIKVPDAAKALMRLGAAHRRTLERTKVIAVTGSSGKTTTVRLIHAALGSRLRGQASVKSFNNAIGVPLTLLRARPADQYLVCEVGMNAPGEIAELARLIEPDIAVITSVGRAHMERFDSVEAICREKASLLSFLRPGGCAVVTAEAPCLADHLKPAPGVITFGRSDAAQLRLTGFEHVEIEGRGPGVRFTVNERASYEIPLPGEHNAMNALAAIAVARRLGLPDEAIAEGLAAVKAPEMRMARRRHGAIEVYNDAYNANPESMKAAISTFAQVAASASRRVVIVGDMLELGDHAPDAHREIGDWILRHDNIDVVVVVGSLALHVAERLERKWPASRIVIVPTLSPSALERIVSALRPGDAVLLKGSRMCRLERIEEAIGAKGAGGAPPAPKGPGAGRRAAGAA